MKAIELSVNSDAVHLDGRPVFAGTLDDLASHIPRLAQQVSSPYLIVTPNVDQVLDARLREDSKRNYEHADLAIIDGAPLRWLVGRMGARDVQRITGADLAATLCQRSGESGSRIAIVGGKDGAAEAAAARVIRANPAAAIKGIPFPYVDDVANAQLDDVISAISDWAPDIVLVCLGAPKQESFVVAHRERLPAAVYVGCGAAVDFLAGTARRAPRVVQVLGLEWLFRFAQEPRRLFTRYFVKGPRFFRLAMSSLAANRANSHGKD